jgi:RNA polymerase sigma-70 factor, ECF subfamily
MRSTGVAGTCGGRTAFALDAILGRSAAPPAKGPCRSGVIPQRAGFAARAGFLAFVLTAVHPNRDAIAELVRQHQAGLRSYLRWLGAASDAADDLVQDTFVVALTQPPVERDPASTGAWLRTVARHLLLRQLRTAGRRGRAIELDEAAAAWEQHLGGADDGETFRVALRACLGELSPRQGEAMRLRYGEDLAVAQVGERMGIGVAGAETLLRRLRSALRVCIERRLA